MHLYEQYQNKDPKETDLFKSYDMVYNLKKFKMNKNLGGLTEKELDQTTHTSNIIKEKIDIYAVDDLF